MTVFEYFLLLFGLVVGFVVGVALGDYYGWQEGRRKVLKGFFKKLHQRN